MNPDSMLKPILYFVAAGFSFFLLGTLFVIQWLLFRRIFTQTESDPGKLQKTHTAVVLILSGLSIAVGLFCLTTALIFWRVEPTMHYESSIKYRTEETFSSSSERSEELPFTGPSPSGTAWDWAIADPEKRELVPHGDGVIAGQILVDGKGVEGQRIRLVLNRKYVTPYARTDAAGIYRIPVKKQEYSYNGWHLSSGFLQSGLAGKILIDDGVTTKAKEYKDGDKRICDIDAITQNRISEFYRTYPLSEAQEKARALMDEKYSLGEIQAKYVLNVTDEPAKVPPLIFVTPVDILFPQEGTALPLENLRIEWAPVANAVSYDVKLGSEELNARGGVSYHHIETFPGIKETSLSAEEIIPVIEIIENRRYTVEVIALDSERHVLSRSRPHYAFEVE